ncbi:MAG TPA: 1-acyl-sn-glycerol-3-phosphate acyltransferase [Bacteroidales bacterium]|nr:1-acyl-sn-glycerol-3-phosphate acyltransferase [Bacteroidales bacterium]HPI67994.1 1-acyl-sn-glycerol-3-phosphate acyltransferase [Bacteroidales bacterium]HPR72439.1 1-acyl-sn-glycerol-3-phosphate acyltransferase [Bacteroidales bacterium]
MGKDNIEKYSKGYTLIRKVSGFWHNNVYYRKVIVLGRDRIDYDKHLIFAPNHQNALMDALAIAYTLRTQPVFLTRADIFKNKFIASILYYLKMLPVYRIRDGYESLKSNEEIFQRTINVLRNKNGLVILPEGNHAGFRRLRQLKKGICRIAFQADEASGFNLNIKIIPVGIEFTHYTRYRQVLTVVYGDPVEVSEFHELYKKTPEIALNELRKKLSSEMKKLIVHIESEEDYEAIDELRSLINGKYSDDIRYPKLFRDRMMIDKLNKLKENDPTLYNKICSLTLKVKKKAGKLKTNYRLLAKKKHPLGWLLAGFFGLLLFLPLFIYGNLFNLTFLLLPNLQTRKIKDVQFHSTMKYGFSLALAIILTPVFLILSFIIFSPWWLAILVFLTIPVSGLFAWNYYLVLMRIIGGFRIKHYTWTRNKEYTALKKDHDELVSLVTAL